MTILLIGLILSVIGAILLVIRDRDKFSKVYVLTEANSGWTSYSMNADPVATDSISESYLVKQKIKNLTGQGDEIFSNNVVNVGLIIRDNRYGLLTSIGTFLLVVGASVQIAGMCS